MASERRDDLLGLNDKLFLSAVLSQLVIMGLIFSAAFGVFIWDKQSDALLKIESNFKEWEGRITEAVYVNRITQSWEMNKLPVVDDFKKSLHVNGYPSEIYVEECGLSSLDSALSFHLQLGGLEISECLYIEQKPSALYAGAFWVAALAFISFLVTSVIWLFVRARFRQKLLQPLIDSMERDAKNVAAGKIASQIAHDIRSPLAALRILMRETYSLPEEKRKLLQSATGRIQDIANNLLPNKKNRLQSKEEVSGELVSSLLDTLVTEKRLQYRDLLHVDIRLELEDNSYSAFASVVASEISRCVSNLIDNSVEAIESKQGQIVIRLDCPSDSKIRIGVEDNGKGITSKNISEVFKERSSFGKSGGTGLGLFYVRQVVKRLDGKIEIESEENVHTKISMILDRDKSPEWFAEEIILEEGMRIAVVDDDSAIHQIWSGRLNSFRAAEKNIEVFHFSSTEDLDRHLSQNKDNFSLYLVDYQFLGSSRTGLDWILENSLQKSSLLVTSRFEEAPLRQKCKTANLKVIPKLLSAYIPFRILEEKEVAAAKK